MSRQYAFNVFSGKFDIIDVASSTGAAAVPNVIATGVTFTVADNTQVLYGRPIVIEAGGILLTVGTGSMVGV